MLGATLVAMSLAATTAAAQEQTTTGDAAERFRAGERAARQQTTSDAAERFRAMERASQAHRDEAGTTPAEATRPARPDGASRRPGHLLALSVLIAALAAVTATSATRRVRARHAV
jgi:hypothetical protein